MRRFLSIAAVGAACACAAPQDEAAEAADTSEGAEDALTAASGVDDPFEVRVSSDRVLWATDEGVFSAPKRSSGWGWWPSARPTHVVKGKLGDGARFGPTFAVDGDAVFALAEGKLVKAPVAGGASTAYAFGLPEVGGVVVDAAHVYLSAKDGVYRAPKDFSGPPSKLGSFSCASSFDRSVRQLTSDDDAVYLVACGDRLLRIEKASGATATLLATGSVSAIAVDGGTLYLLGEGELRSMPATGGAPMPLLSGTDTHSLAVSGDTILLSSISKLVRFDAATGQARTLATYGATIGFPPWATKLGALKDVAIDGADYYYAVGNTRPVTGPWPEDPNPRTGKIGYERVR